MPRQLRIHVPGGIYHVTLRGNHRQPIFFTAADRKLLNAIVVRAIETFEPRVHAYCWMTNHIHLVLQAGAEPIARPMHNIAAEFARAMQLKMQTTGHFFERRYHANLVDTDSYMLELLRYVHCNPVTAGLARGAGAWTWSSHHNYIGTRNEDWVTTDFALRMFAADRARAVAAYRRFVDAEQVEPWNPEQVKNRGVAVLGDDDFIARVAAKSRSRIRTQSLEDLLLEACGIFGVQREMLASQSRCSDLARVRAWIVRQATKRGIATVSAVAREVGRTEGALRYLLKVIPEEAE